MSTQAHQVSIVIPLYNEALIIRSLVDRIEGAMKPLGISYELILVNDGSTDATEQAITECRAEHPNIFYINLSRNFGHHNAIRAGLDYAHGECVIMMDGDLEHPPELLPALIREWQNGFYIVNTKRIDTSHQSYFKKKSSTLFYKILNALSGLHIEDGSADFRLIDRKIVNIIRKLNEPDLFMRGIVHWLGFKETSLEYVRGERYAGSTKYTKKKMLRLAIYGITAFSTKPLYLSVYMGLFFIFLSSLLVPYVLWSYFFGSVEKGWSSMMLVIGFFGGLQLMNIGIIGVYLGNVFKQSKQRPHYFIESSNIQSANDDLINN